MFKLQDFESQCRIRKSTISSCFFNWANSEAIVLNKTFYKEQWQVRTTCDCETTRICESLWETSIPGSTTKPCVGQRSWGRSKQFKTSNSGDGLSTIHTVHTYDGALEVNCFVFFSVLLKTMFGATSPASIMIGPCLNSCVGFFDDICQCPLNHVLLKPTTLASFASHWVMPAKKELPPTKASHFLSETKLQK